MKNFIIAIALMFSAFTFAQTSQGTWTFGIGDNFTSVPNGHEANAGYFVMDGVMVSLGFHMMTETADGAEGEAATEGAEATAEAGAKDGESAKKDEKGKDTPSDKKVAEKKPAEKKPPEKK